MVIQQREGHFYPLKLTILLAIITGHLLASCNFIFSVFNLTWSLLVSFSFYLFLFLTIFIRQIMVLIHWNVINAILNSFALMTHNFVSAWYHFQVNFCGRGIALLSFCSSFLILHVGDFVFSQFHVFFCVFHLILACCSLLIIVTVDHFYNILLISILFKLT